MASDTFTSCLDLAGSHLMATLSAMMKSPTAAFMVAAKTVPPAPATLATREADAPRHEGRHPHERGEGQSGIAAKDPEPADGERDREWDTRLKQRPITGRDTPDLGTR